MTYSKPWDLANQLLSAVVAEYTLAVAAEPSNELLPLPTTQYVANGAVPFDQELLAVNLARLYGIGSDSGIPYEAIEPQRCLLWRAAAFEIVLLRCAPNLDDHPYEGQPTVPYALVEQSAEQVMVDAQIITQGILRAWKTESFGIGPVLAFETWTAIPPQGGIVGGSLMVRIGLTG